MNNKPKIFVGSSVEGLTVAYAVQQNLTYEADVTVWDQGVFELSQTSIESLINILHGSDFAIFVFSPDDITKIRQKAHLTVRDNVIFELGLFIGKLGRERTFIIMPNKPIFHIPTDLLGVTAGKYDANRTDGSLQAATGPVCHQIRIQIKKLGLVSVINTENVSQKDEFEIVESGYSNSQDWWEMFISKDYKSALTLVEEKLKKEPEDKDTRFELTFKKLLVDYHLDISKGHESALKILEEGKDNKAIYAMVSRVQLFKDELPAAMAVINKGLEKFPGDPILISRKSEFFEKNGKGDLAIETIIGVPNYESDESLVLRLVEIYENLEEKKLEEAYTLVLNCLKTNQDSEQLIYKLGRLSQETERKSLGLLLFDRLTKKYPKNPTYWGYLGNSATDLKLYNKGLTFYKEAEKLSNSKEAWIIANIGNLLKNQGLYTEARGYLKRACEIDKDSEYNFNRMGITIKLEQEEDKKYSNILKEGLSLFSPQ